jgi:hypothetical protein
MLRAVCLIVVLITLGCATTGKYEAILNRWEGQSVNNLITRWGPPNQSFELPNGQKMYKWRWASGPQTVSNYNAYSGQVFTNTYNWWCDTTFTAEKDVVISWQYQGNPPPRELERANFLSERPPAGSQ